MPTRKLSYAEQLKDPRWQRKRLEILQRDQFTCCRCDDSTNTLHVHHKYYERGLMAWEYDDGTLVTLCERCHEWVTQITCMIHRWLADVWIGELETVLGYVQGRFMTWISGHEVDATPATAEGIGHAFLLTKDEVADCLSPDITLTGEALYEVVRRKMQPSDQSSPKHIEDAFLPHLGC